MPYLHWETDQMRNTVAKTVESASLKQSKKMEATVRTSERSAKC